MASFIRLIVPITINQMGKIERKHRHVIEIGLTLLAQAYLLSHFWLKAFLFAIYLINMLPSIVTTFLEGIATRDNKKILKK